IEQEAGGKIALSCHAVEAVRGILATCHVFLKDSIGTKDLWKIFRDAYGSEPFVRIVTEASGLYRFPEPKILAGTNFCDVGFAVDPHAGRVVAVAALDNRNRIAVYGSGDDGGLHDGPHREAEHRDRRPPAIPGRASGRPERRRWRPPDRPPQGGRAIRRQRPGAAPEGRPLRHSRTGECDLDPASLRRGLRSRDLSARRDAPGRIDQRGRGPDRGPGRGRDGGPGPCAADERPRTAPRAERPIDLDSRGPARAPSYFHGLRVRPDEEEVDRRRGSAGGRRAARRHRLFPATGSRRTGPRRHGDGDLVSAAAARAVKFAS